jgi:hypothetical protein
MPNFIKKILDEIYNQAWTIAGTLLVLITLSGDVQRWAIWISCVTLAVDLLVAGFKKNEDDNNE